MYAMRCIKVNIVTVLGLLAVLLGLSGVAPAQSQFAGKWQTKVSPPTGKHLFTVNINLADGSIRGTMFLVDPVNGSEIESQITDAEWSEHVLEFKTKVRNSTFYWRLTLRKSNRKGLLHGSVGEMLIDEPVVKQR